MCCVLRILFAMWEIINMCYYLGHSPEHQKPQVLKENGEFAVCRYMHSECQEFLFQVNISHDSSAAQSRNTHQPVLDPCLDTGWNGQKGGTCRVGRASVEFVGELGTLPHRYSGRTDKFFHDTL